MFVWVSAAGEFECACQSVVGFVTCECGTVGVCVDVSVCVCVSVKYGVNENNIH